MTTDEKRRLELILARHGISRKVRRRAIAATKEWLAAPAAQTNKVTNKAKADATVNKTLVAELRRARNFLADVKENAT